MAGTPTEAEPFYRTLSAEDYAGIRILLESDPAGLTDADSEDRVAAFIERNSPYCVGAVADGILVGMIMCGCDGRSARIYHLVVAPEWRRRGVAHALIGRAYDALRSEGIAVLDVIVFRESPGSEFWDSEGFRDRSDLAYRDFPMDDL